MSSFSSWEKPSTSKAFYCSAGDMGLEVSGRSILWLQMVSMRPIRQRVNSINFVPRVGHQRLNLQSIEVHLANAMSTKAGNLLPTSDISSIILTSVIRNSSESSTPAISVLPWDTKWYFLMSFSSKSFSDYKRALSFCSNSWKQKQLVID